MHFTELETPCALVDITRLDANIQNWSAYMDARGVGLRPHTKTSKTPQVIQRQVDAGAVGLTVATLGEAEVLVDHGFDNIFQAYPLWVANKHRAQRLRDLHERCELIVGVESVPAAKLLGAAVKSSGRPLRVLVEVDAGLHRTGIDPDRAATVARAAENAGLLVMGAFTYGGHTYGSTLPAEAADDEVRALEAAAERLTNAGFSASILSAGSTPTSKLSARRPVTDERAGTYVFHDAQQVSLKTASLDEVAFTIAATVIADYEDGRFVVDAGSKILGSDKPAWRESYGMFFNYGNANLYSLSEHHGVAHSPSNRPSLGEIVQIAPNHVCLAVNLVDRMYACIDGEVVDEWVVAGRGKNF